MLEQRKQEWISAYVDDELSSADRDVVKRWLEQDTACRELHDYLLELRSQLGRLRGADVDNSLDRDLTSAVLRAIDQQPAPPWLAAEPRLQQAPDKPVAPVEPSAPASASGGAAIVVRLLAVAAALALAIFVARPGEGPQSPPEDVAVDGPDHARGGRPSNADVGPQDDEPDDAQYVAAQPASFILVEVELTAKGVQRGSVQAALNQAGLGLASGVPVDAELERAFMESRFFAPPDLVDSDADSVDADETSPAPGAGEQGGEPVLRDMLYCVVSGPQLDAMWDYLAKEHVNAAVGKVQIDVAFLTDVALFETLHEASEGQLITQATPAAPVEDDKPALRLRAQRLLLTAALQTKLGRGLRVLSGPALGVLSGVLSQAGAPANDAGTEQPEDVEPTPAQQELMARKTTGLLLVVRTRGAAK